MAIGHTSPTRPHPPAEFFDTYAETLAALGFDVNALGRTDVPSDQPWQTALHKAAEDGHLELARTLLRLGADPDLRDRRFDSTPLGWARYFGQEPLIALLEPLTRPDPASAGTPPEGTDPAGPGPAPAGPAS